MAKAFCAARTGAAFVAALWLAVAALSCPAHAQADYPSRAIRVVTPFAAGAASDIALRILAEKMSARLNVPMVVQNQPGGGGVIAGRSVTNAPADGYTIAWVGNNTAIGVSEFAYLFVTSATSPYMTLADWMNTAKQKPGTLSAGTSNAGTSNHLTALLFKSAQHLDFIVVPYRGPAELSVALLRNDVDLVVNAYGGLRAAIDAKQIRPLAATSAARLPELPDVPTMKEAGVDDFVVSSWNGLYGPKDMPKQAVDVLARAATEALAQPDVKAQFKEIGFDARALPADAQDKLMRTEIDRWAKVIADAGISKQ